MKICIIKLGADGDVLRTLPLAKALKETYNAEITWITKGDVSTLLKGNPYIDHVAAVPWKKKEKFDKLYNFDMDEAANSLAMSIEANEKRGFYLNEGYATAFNPGAEYYLNTVFDDNLKKENRKTYQEMMFMAADLPYTRELVGIDLDKKDLKYANDFVAKNKINTDRLIGIHMGASSRWPSKVWAKENVIEFIGKARKKGYEVLLFGGPAESSEHGKMAKELEKASIKIYRNNPKNTKREFAALVSLCNVMICSDSLSLHVSLALEKKTIGLFFCTTPHEVEDYGLLTKMVSLYFEDFFPQRMNVYDEQLVKSISADEVIYALEKIEKARQ